MHAHPTTDNNLKLKQQNSISSKNSPPHVLTAEIPFN